MAVPSARLITVYKKIGLQEKRRLRNDTQHFDFATVSDHFLFPFMDSELGFSFAFFFPTRIGLEFGRLGIKNG